MLSRFEVGKGQRGLCSEVVHELKLELARDCGVDSCSDEIGGRLVEWHNGSSGWRGGGRSSGRGSVSGGIR